MYGLGMAHNRAHFARAAMEGVANCLADVWDALYGSETSNEMVRVTGGITVLVSHRFSTVRMADAIVAMLADPAGARALLDRLGVQPADAVLIGDSAVDVATARNAGIAFVGVTWGLVPRAALVQAGATTLVDLPGALAPWLA